MWTTLAETQVSLTIPALAPEWVQLAQTSLVVGVSVPPTPEWVQLAQASIAVSIAAPPVVEWVLLAQKQIGITVPGVPEPPPPVLPVPPEETKFPWLPVALIGGGLIAVVASVKPTKKPTKKKEVKHG